MPGGGNEKITLRLNREDREALEQYAERCAEHAPPLRDHLFRIDGTPKISAIVRFAALASITKHRGGIFQ